jgi:hypothetical protein
VDQEFIKAYAVSATPLALITGQGTIYRQDIKVDFESSAHATVTVPYAKDDKSAGSINWNYDTTGGTVRLKAALEHLATYPAGQEGHGGAIGVNGEDVEGVEIVIPALKIGVDVSHPAGVVTLNRVFQLADDTGTVNDDTFLTKPAGSFLFLGSTGSDGSEAEAQASYQFAYSKNLQNQIIGGITVAEKQGWDVSWVEFKDDVAAGKPIRPPKAIHVERVYRRVNFPALFGFG